MHVNSYFIESLVLCFSCGCDNGNLQYGKQNGNIGGWTNSTATCSMNNPARVIIGKQIQWSDQFGDQCSSDGPLEYDLPAIKEIIRLQFNTPPPSCDKEPTPPWTRINSDVLEPPSIPIEPPQYPPEIDIPPAEIDWPVPPLLPVPDIQYEPWNWFPQPPPYPEPIEIRPRPWIPWIPQPPQIDTWTPPLIYPNWPIPENTEWIPQVPDYDWPLPYEPYEPYEPSPPTEPEPWIPIPPEWPPEDNIIVPTEEPFYPIIDELPTEQSQEEPDYIIPTEYPEYPEEPVVPIIIPTPPPSILPPEDDTPPGIFIPDFSVETIDPTTEAPPNIDHVTITIYKGTEIIKVSIAQVISTIGIEIKTWLEQYPTGRVVWVITAEDTSKPNWPEEVRELLITETEIPTFVVIVDWSMYVSPEYTVTVEHGYLLSKTLTETIYEMQISDSQLTIIGFGTSSHVAGYIGKLTQNIYGVTIFKIIALNPTGLLYTEMVHVEHRLSKFDAQMVMVIHTETVEVGTAEPVGTIDVFVNDPQEGQPWCRGNPQCSHESVIDIFILSYKFQPVLVTKETTNEILIGFPFDVEITETGIYYLITDDKGIPQPLPPENWPTEEVEIIYFPPVNISQFPSRDVNELLVVGQKTSGAEVVLSWNEQSADVMEFLLINPLAEVFVIITEEPYNQWAVQVREALLNKPGLSYVIIIDWSRYKYQSYVFTVNAYSQLIAEAVATFLKLNEVPLSLTEVIGFSTSAHIAGMIGSIIATDGELISRITGLDPEARMWMHSPQVRLSEFHAATVQVIHTNTRNWGILEPLGKYDIYVFGGAIQPECEGQADINGCSHLKAIEYYIASINDRYLAFQGEIVDSVAVRTGDAAILFGYNLKPNPMENIRIYVIEGFTAIIDEVPAVVDLPPISEGWPQVVFVDSIPGIAVQIFFYEGDVVKVITAYFNGRHPALGQIISQIIGLTGETLTYLIIDGEYLKDEEWSTLLSNKIMTKVGAQAIVMRLDWSPYKLQGYSISASYSKAIASFVAPTLAEMRVPLSQLHVIGFSVGAHIAGFLGQEIQMLTSTQIGRISGLDPARPMFSNIEVDIGSRLSPDDAIFVDVYHTNIMVYGFTDPIGTMDYYINGGLIQPGCSGGDHLCSHYRAVLVYMISMDIRDLALEVRYIGDGKLVYISETRFADFGFFYQNGNPGVYYIKTEPEPPYLRPGRRIENLPAGIQVETINIDGGKQVETKYVDIKENVNVADTISVDYYTLKPEIETYTKIIRIESPPQMMNYDIRSSFNKTST